MPFTRVSIVLLGLFLLSIGQAGAAVMVSVDVNSSYIPADGKSFTQVLVTALNTSGGPVPDGTEIRLTTSAGDVSPVVYTTGGRAVGVLTSSTCPQSATINAICNGVSSSVQVEYTESAGGDEESRSDSSISMVGGSLAYCVERDTIVGSSTVTLEYKGVRVEAENLQLRQGTGQIRAQGNVVVSKGETTLTGDRFLLNMRNDRIYLQSLSGSRDITACDVAKLQQLDTENANVDESSFAQSLDAKGSTWIISPKLTLIPGQKILFFKASIYVRESKVMTLPYYAFSYKDRKSILQQVRYTANDGMMVDLPFYCQLSESRASAIKLRYSSGDNESGGYARPRKGPSLGLQHDYLAGRAGYGTMFVDSLGSSNLAYELAHHTEFGSAHNSGRADFSARYQPSSNYAKDIHYATLNITGNMPKYNYTVLGYFGGSKIRHPLSADGYFDQSHWSLRTMVRSNKAIASTPVGKVFPSLTFGYGMPSGAMTSCLYNSVGLTANHTKKLSGSLSAGLSQSAAFTVTANGDTGSELRFRPSLRTNWMGGSASMGYTLNLRSGLNDILWSQGRHQLDTTLYMDIGSRLNCSSTFDLGLDSKRMNLFSSVSYRASKLWDIRANYDLYKYTYRMGSNSYDFKTSYFRVGVFRPVGLYEIGLVWSPDGQQYGSINQGKRLWIELSAAGF